MKNNTQALARAEDAGGWKPVLYKTKLDWNDFTVPRRPETGQLWARKRGQHVLLMAQKDTVAVSDG